MTLLAIQMQTTALSKDGYPTGLKAAVRTSTFKGARRRPKSLAVSPTSTVKTGSGCFPGSEPEASVPRASTTVADWEPAIYLGNARLLELGDLNVPADATSLYQ